MMNSQTTLIVVIIGLFSRLVSSEEEAILDTRTATSDLGWPASPGGWTEVSTDDGTGADLRTFQVCRIHSPNQNNWLRTNYIEVGSAERVYVEIRFTTRSCEGLAGIVTCKETFNLYYMPSEGRDDRRASIMREQPYVKVDTIAADERFKPDSVKENTETRVINRLVTRGLYIAIQDTGACMAIMHVRVYYKTCTAMTRGLAVFPVTVTGPEVTSLVDVSGTCVVNAQRMHDSPAPSLLCNGEGAWIVPSGRCECSAGYEPNDKMTKCTACEPGKFKADAGSTVCSICPSNSAVDETGATSCKCSQSFFRAPTDRLDAGCTKSPSKPVMLESLVNKTEVTLTWSEPYFTGGRMDITYTVSCEQCDATMSMCFACGRNVDFYPRRESLTLERVTITDLLPFTHYKFKVYSFNGVSQVSGSNPEFSEISLRTNQAAPSRVSPVRILSVHSTHVLLQWDAPTSSLPVLSYQIRYSSIHGTVSNSTTSTSFSLVNLTPSTSYTVQVRAKSDAGFGLYGRKTAFRTKIIKVTMVSPSNMVLSHKGFSTSETEQNDDDVITKSLPDRKQLILAIVVTCSLLMITIGILLIIWGRRRKYSKTVIADFEKYPGFINTSVDLISTKTYVDPSTYEDPYSAVQEFAKEIDYKLVNIEQVIGRGEFGEVCKGELTSTSQTVAIKTLKAGYSSQEKLDFLSEASIMGQFDHDNVIRLEGVVTKSRPLMIITEFMKNGSLDDYLRKNEGKIPIIRLTQILHNIACGMEYLSEMGYVHRDLAARNVLVSKDFVCKVSDFGLSRVLEAVGDEDVAMYTTRGGMIPIRWTAPEAITQRTFSSSSDVWSYGIVTWEVLSFGERPYWEMSNQDVVHFVDSGYRLPAPCFCPRVLHSMMIDCWQSDRSTRPTFKHLVTQLGRFLCDVNCLNDTLNNRPYRDQEDCIPEILDLSSLGQWLEQMHLLQYKPIMLRHGCVTAEQIMRFTKSDLESMGIEDCMELETILQEANVLRRKIEEVNNMGVAV